jgi:hypothetical protein
VTAVTPGQAEIDLLSYGKLIKPVQVEGKWYYFWDRSGDGTSADVGALNGGVDTVSHDTLDSIFKYDINGNLNPEAGTNTNSVYRYATINGVQLALPTVNGNLPTTYNGSTWDGTSYSDAGATSNGTSSVPYDELMAVIDAYDGSASGYVAGWNNANIPGWRMG